MTQSPEEAAPELRDKIAGTYFSMRQNYGPSWGKPVASWELAPPQVVAHCYDVADALMPLITAREKAATEKERQRCAEVAREVAYIATTCAALSQTSDDRRGFKCQQTGALDVAAAILKGDDK